MRSALISVCVFLPLAIITCVAAKEVSPNWQWVVGWTGGLFAMVAREFAKAVFRA